MNVRESNAFQVASGTTFMLFMLRAHEYDKYQTMDMRLHRICVTNMKKDMNQKENSTI